MSLKYDPASGHLWVRMVFVPRLAPMLCRAAAERRLQQSHARTPTLQVQGYFAHQKPPHPSTLQ